MKKDKTQNDMANVTKKEIEKLEKQIEETDEIIEGLEAQQEKNRKRLKVLKETLKNIEGPERCVRVSDHALLRYLERNKGIDVEAVRREIRDQLIEIEITDVDMKYNGFIIRNNTAVTYFP